MTKSNSLLGKMIDGFYRLLEFVMVACMGVMFVLVFVNVIMRIVFNTSSDFSEELPRFAFVWMIFVGAVVGVRKNTHLGVDMFVLALPIVGRKICWVICQSLMIVCSAYMLYGTWMQHHIISANSSAVMRISLLWVYGISYLTGTVISLICIAKLVRFALGPMDDSEFIEKPATDSGASSGPGELDTGDSARQEGPRT